MISAVFRRGGDVSFVVEELKAVFDPRGGQWLQGKYVPSLLAAIGQVLEDHMISIGFIQGEEMPIQNDQDSNSMVVHINDPHPEVGFSFRQCPRCGQANLIRQENCDSCTSCLYSKCG